MNSAFSSHEDAGLLLRRESTKMILTLTQVKFVRRENDIYILDACQQILADI